MVDIPSDGYSSPPSSCGDDPDDILFNMNWLRIEVDLPPLNSQGEQVLDKEEQIQYTPDEEIDRKQVELVASQIALEELRQHDRLLTTKNDMLVLRHNEGILSRVKEELARFRATNEELKVAGNSFQHLDIND
ncbi:hypothetical protein POM88_005508 [Heracleum sosnowskyi]|uniref:Uncharacterized protein n=1 Tax=Heracleum sosnowskyi TaxID=360622 RepID=A0AAD8J0T9_9APIA|nr:hypothetical protein POM88_005508 [Heracleum sosnowskyi]